jgi:hypothetical protein
MVLATLKPLPGLVALVDVRFHVFFHLAQTILDVLKGLRALVVPDLNTHATFIDATKLDANVGIDRVESVEIFLVLSQEQSQNAGMDLDKTEERHDEKMNVNGTNDEN